MTQHPTGMVFHAVLRRAAHLEQNEGYSADAAYTAATDEYAQLQRYLKQALRLLYVVEQANDVLTVLVANVAEKYAMADAECDELREQVAALRRALDAAEQARRGPHTPPVVRVAAALGREIQTKQCPACGAVLGSKGAHRHIVACERRTAQERTED